VRSQSLVYSPRSAWRRVVSLGWNATLFRRLAANPLLRLGVHPPDANFPSLWRQIERLTRRALKTRTPQTYASFSGSRQRPSRIRVRNEH